VTALAMVLFGVSVLVDVRAESAFDAPKRLLTLLGVGIAVAVLLVAPGRRGTGWSWSTATVEQRLALALAGAGYALALVSALLSPRRPASFDAWRALSLYALLLPLGAVGPLGGRRSRILLGSFVGGVSVNAAIALLQFSGALHLFRVTAVGGRQEASALVGNDGALALSLALGCLGCLGVVLAARSVAVRLAAGGGIALQLAALVVAQSLTALTALTVGALVLVVLSLGRRTLIAGLVVVVMVVGGLAVEPSLSKRARGALESIRAGDWDTALSYRLGPWAAALEMIRSRPLVGWGPGTFGAEFVAHRLRAELRLHRRLVAPVAGAFGEAHSEYLQVAAEAGLVASSAALAAFGVVLVGLARAVRREPDGPDRAEAIVVLAVLCAGGVVALTWFPLQRPVTAVPLLLAAGRAWRLSGGLGAGGS
jgi:O-antigen ligase